VSFIADPLLHSVRRLSKDKSRAGICSNIAISAMIRRALSCGKHRPSHAIAVDSATICSKSRDTLQADYELTICRADDNSTPDEAERRQRGATIDNQERVATNQDFDAVAIHVSSTNKDHVRRPEGKIHQDLAGRGADDQPTSFSLHVPCHGSDADLVPRRYKQWSIPIVKQQHADLKVTVDDFEFYEWGPVNSNGAVSLVSWFEHHRDRVCDDELARIACEEFLARSLRATPDIYGASASTIRNRRKRWFS
jgi:hypothetical protein